MLLRQYGVSDTEQIGLDWMAFVCLLLAAVQRMSRLAPPGRHGKETRFYQMTLAQWLQPSGEW